MDSTSHHQKTQITRQGFTPFITFIGKASHNEDKTTSGLHYNNKYIDLKLRRRIDAELTSTPEEGGSRLQSDACINSKMSDEKLLESWVFKAEKIEHLTILLLYLLSRLQGGVSKFSSSSSRHRRHPQRYPIRTNKHSPSPRRRRRGVPLDRGRGAVPA